MTDHWWAGYNGSDESFRVVSEHLPSLKVRREGETTLLSDPCLDLGSKDTRRVDLAKFTDLANAVLLLSNSNADPIRQHGPVFLEDENGCRHYVLLPETGVFSLVFYPVTLSARGVTGAREPRALGARVAEFFARSDHFAKASAFLTNAGNDLREIYKAMEAIERGHGGWPKKADRERRAAFCAALMVEEDEWEALHRTARPARHAYPHNMVGHTFTANQVRAAVQHALKVWLEREVPL